MLENYCKTASKGRRPFVLEITSPQTVKIDTFQGGSYEAVQVGDTVQYHAQPLEVRKLREGLHPEAGQAIIVDLQRQNGRRGRDGTQ